MYNVKEKSLLNYDQPELLAYRKHKRDASGMQRGIAGGDGLFKRFYTIITLFYFF